MNDALISYTDLKKTVQDSAISKTLVVKDSHIFNLTDIEKKLNEIVSKSDTVVTEVPQGLLELHTIESIYNKVKNSKPEMILGIGGGTVLDTVKLINVLFSTGCAPGDVLAAAKTMADSIPMVMLPTTAGTGSEATHFAVLYINKIKISVTSPFLLPHKVLLDPDLVMTMPRNVAISTGFDALSQAIEAYWSIHSTEESKRYSRESIQLINKAFIPSILAADSENRTMMQHAAYYAGKAINIAKTTAAHAISYPLSSFFKIPHGLAVFLTLPSIFLFNKSVTSDDCTDKRGVEQVKQTISELETLLHQGTSSTAEYFFTYFKKYDISRTLASYGITEKKDVETVLDNGFNPERMGNNPRRITRGALERILTDLL